MRKKKRILFVLIVLNLVFIWGNSMLSGDASGHISSGLLSKLRELFPALIHLGEFLLRKLGHFSEFTVLGCLLCALMQQFHQRGIHAVTMPLLPGVLAALTDETIQVFSPGRGPSVIDVWIDTSGVCVGIALFLIGYTIRKKKNERKTKQ